MHTTYTTEANGKWMAYCDCGWSMTEFNSQSDAQSAASTHKQLADGSPNQQPGGSDDPHIGY